MCVYLCNIFEVCSISLKRFRLGEGEGGAILRTPKIPTQIRVNADISFILDADNENSLLDYQAVECMIFNFHGY